MSRLGTTAVTLLLLGAADALVTHRLEALYGRHVTRWLSDTEWSEALGDETWHSGRPGPGGRQDRVSRIEVPRGVDAAASGSRTG